MDFVQTCLKGSVCRVVLHVSKGIQTQCLSPKEIPAGGDSSRCGRSGHPLLVVNKEGKKGPRYSVFKCNEVCPYFHLVFVHGVCCAEVDICTLPKDSGPCKARVGRYYYDTRKKACLKFFYGGCAGNKNNFRTLQDCQKACASITPPPPGPKPTCPVGPPFVVYHKQGPSVVAFCGRGPNRTDCPPTHYCNIHPADLYAICCRRTQKPGQCPNLPGPGICISQCKSDRDCKDDDKCCSNGCGRICIKPVPVVTCAAVLCIVGTKCVEDSVNGARCVPHDRCLQNKDPGPCEAAIKSYFYNAKLKKCEQFVYGGCQGNDNRFKTEHECIKACAKKDICQLPRKPGPCKASFKRYYYDSHKHKCLKFTYGGCQGNENNFKTKADCQKACRKPTPGVCPGSLPKNANCGQHQCKDDFDCPKRKKCCRVGCKTSICVTPLPPCAVVLCSSGHVCVDGKCVPIKKPGQCPKPQGAGICISLCESDQDCKGNNKCCSNGCGQICKNPVPEITCANVLCSEGTVCVETDNGPKCVRVRPGKCPQFRCPIPFPPQCLDECKYDDQCPAGKKCCNGCKGCRQCFTPFGVPANPCDKVKCKPDEVCKLEQVQCVRAPCPPQPTCVPKDKPGHCPRIYLLICPKRSVKPCQNDQQCPGDEKCCKDNCGNTACRDPLPSCKNTRCKPGTKCIISGGKPTCIPITKPGICLAFPCALPPPFPPMCTDGCQHDNDCKGDRKCCPDCSRCKNCHSPQPPPPPPSCKTVECKPGQVCILKKVLCKKPPCHPTPTCVAKDFCQLPSITGRCRAYIPSYFFNSKSGRCERFIYGGCGGNDNRFETEKHCKKACLP
ncbi:hypothetical protein ACOMHN_029794 [Nucella lapillus]